MIDLSFLAFLLLLALVLVWALQQPTRLLSAPFQMAGTCLFFVAPQLYVLRANPNLVPPESLAHYIFYATGCLLFCVFGYCLSPRLKKERRVIQAINVTKFAKITLATSIAGLGGMVSLGIYLQIFGVPGFWYGWPVYLYTLSKLVFPALILSRLLFFSTGVNKYRLLSIVLAWPILIQAFQNGRRSWTFMFIFSWFLPAVMAGKVKIRPTYGIIAVLAAFFVVTLFPAYRDYARDKGYAAVWEQIKERPPSEVLAHYFSGNQTLEVRDAVVLTGIVRKFGRFSYGAGIYNRIVQNYVPGGLIGRDFKASLMLSTPEYENLEQDLQDQSRFFGGEVKYYTAKTGFFDSYAEFWYFGLAMYFVMGLAFRYAEDLCFRRSDIRGILFMCFLGFLPAAAVYDEWGGVLTLYLPTTFIFYFCVRFGTKEVLRKESDRFRRSRQRQRLTRV